MARSLFEWRLGSLENNIDVSTVRLKSSRAHLSDPTVDLPSKPRLLPPADINRLAVSLATSPLFQKTARRQWYDYNSDRTPSLSSSEVSTPDLMNGLEPSISDVTSLDFFLISEAAKSQPQSTARVKRRAIVDAKVRSHPVLSVALDESDVESAFKIGTCLAFDVPYGCSRVKALSITRLPRDGAGRRMDSIKLRLADILVKQATRSRGLMLVTEIDLTEKFREAALCELSTFAEADTYSRTIIDPTSDLLQYSIDMSHYLLADELSDRRRVLDLLGQVTSSFAHLTPRTCTQETLDLVALVENLREEQQAVLLLHIDDLCWKKGALVKKARISWMSSYLYDLINEDEESQEGGEDFLLAVKQGLQERVSEEIAFRKVIRWKMGQTMVEYLPLVGGIGEQVGAWLCVFDIM